MAGLASACSYAAQREWMIPMNGALAGWRGWGSSICWNVGREWCVLLVHKYIGYEQRVKCADLPAPWYRVVWLHKSSESAIKFWKLVIWINDSLVRLLSDFDFEGDGEVSLVTELRVLVYRVCTMFALGIAHSLQSIEISIFFSKTLIV